MGTSLATGFDLPGLIGILADEGISEWRQERPGTYQRWEMRKGEWVKTCFQWNTPEIIIKINQPNKS